MFLYVSSHRYPLPEKPRQKRAVIQDMVRPLKHWLLRHRHNPYPTKAEKAELAMGSNMTLVQVRLAQANFFKKNSSYCCWDLGDTKNAMGEKNRQFSSFRSPTGSRTLGAD